MKLYITLFLILFNFITFGKIYADTKISYVDLQKILTKSLAAKSINSQIQMINKKNSKIINDIQQNLLKEEKLIVSQKNILEVGEFNSKATEFKKKVEQYNKNKEKLIEEVNEKNLMGRKKLLEFLNPILAKYSDEKSISLIIQKKNIIIGKSELDITDDIMNILNDKIKKISLN